MNCKIRVLVVEDSLVERQMLMSELSKCGYEVETAADGWLAVDRMSKVGSDIPDIVLMDAIMPIMDGFTACKMITELPPERSAPVLMVTRREDEISIEQAFAAGAEDYIVKPVNIVLLHHRIKHIVKSRQAEALMREMIYLDILTGLPNRRMFEEELDRWLSRAVRYQENIAVVLLDLDKFKQVNDSLGHAIGDAVLKEISRRLTAAVRKSDFVSRLSGDEFLIMLSHIEDKAALAPMMHRIIYSCKEPIIDEGCCVTIGVSIGISFFPEDGCNVMELMRKADTAMYQSKKKGGSIYTCYAQ